MTTVYFIRHAQADYSIRDSRVRPLTPKGLKDRHLVTAFLEGKHINVVLSSPYRRAMETIAPFAEQNGFAIEAVEEFRERRSDSGWTRYDDFEALMARQWADFSYTLSDGECLAAVQARNIAALRRVLARYEGKTIVIGTHGTALSTIINYYDNTFGFTDFMAMVYINPWVVKMHFDESGCIEIEKIDLFS